MSMTYGMTEKGTPQFAAAVLILASIHADCVTRAKYDDALADALASVATDWTEGEETEYWGVDADGAAWRVHLTREEASK